MPTAFRFPLLCRSILTRRWQSQRGVNLCGAYSRARALSGARVCGAVALTVSLGSAQPGFGQAPSAKLSAVLNQVIAQSARTGATITGRIGIVLVNNDTVRTGARSAAGLTFTDGTVLRMGELSEMTVHPGRFHDVKLASGSVFGDFKGPGRITGRYAVAAVRGTKVLMTAMGGDDAVANYEDGAGQHEVDVARSDNTQILAGIINRANGNQVQSDTLIVDAGGTPQAWDGARLHAGSGAAVQDYTVVAYDPTTGTLTLDRPFAGPFGATGARAQAGAAGGTPDMMGLSIRFTLIRPGNAVVRTLQPGQETHVPSTPGAPPSQPTSTPSANFPMGMEYPSFYNVLAGQEIQSGLTENLHTQFQMANFEFDVPHRTEEPVAPGIITGQGAPLSVPPEFGGPVQQVPVPVPDTGGVGVVIPGAGTGGVNVLVGVPASRAASALRVNRPDFSALGYQPSERPGAALAHVSASAVFSDLFMRAGVRAATYGNRDELVLDEALLHYRHTGIGDIEAGRFHWFPGPVSNSLLGRLISFFTADGARWRLPIPGPVSAEAAYFARIDPLQGPATSGYAARLGTQISSVHVGVTGLMGSVARGRIGTSVDASVPVIPRSVEAYGEVGRDLLRENFYTGGLYLPYFFKTLHTDIYLEHSQRQNFGGETDLSAHFPLSTNLSGLTVLRKIGARDWKPSFGLLAHY